jgi:hypothetical protein
MSTPPARPSGRLKSHIDPDREATLLFSLLGLTISLVVGAFYPEIFVALGG